MESAIQAVRGRGWDVNPYTVAEEAKVSYLDISKNSEFMQLILTARGGDVSFQSSQEQQARVNELEEEVRKLQEKLSTSQELAGIPTNDDVLNEQVKALLSSESDDHVKHLELELEGAYHQITSLEEEKFDLTRSVTGLEKINEALNHRMRELETNSAELRKTLAEQPAGKPDKSYEEMETINREMALRLEELISNHRANNEHIALLEATNNQHESLILELEAKLAELQQEADMLALQLQNAFNVGYQKAVADQRAAAPAPTQGALAAEAARQVQEISQELTGEFGAPETQHPAESYEMQMHGQSVNETPEESHVHGWGPEADHVLNFARTGPYVASNFNPLESLSWRDLETVYSMGVLSIKDFSRNLTDYVNADGSGGEIEEPASAESVQSFQTRPGETPAQQPPRTPRQTFPDDTIQPGAGLAPVKQQQQLFPEYTVETQAFSPEELQAAHSQHTEVQQMLEQEQPHLDAYGHPVGEDAQSETRMFQAESQAPLAPPPTDGALDFIDELIDLDKLDIFESLEELAELGNIDVLNEPVNIIDFSDANETTTETPGIDPGTPVSDTELRDLIASRIQSAQQDTSGDQTVRTPPAPEGDEVKQKPIPGLSRKFVGGKAAQTESSTVTPSVASSTTNASVLSKHIPAEIRKSCMILGIRPEDLTKELVNKEWKRQITSVHPDLKGGDTESSIYLNTAKDTLLRWLDQNTPKLGGKFGAKGGGSSPFTGKNKSDDKS